MLGPPWAEPLDEALVGQSWALISPPGLLHLCKTPALWNDDVTNIYLGSPISPRRPLSFHGRQDKKQEVTLETEGSPFKSWGQHFPALGPAQDVSLNLSFLNCQMGIMSHLRELWSLVSRRPPSCCSRSCPGASISFSEIWGSAGCQPVSAKRLVVKIGRSMYTTPVPDLAQDRAGVEVGTAAPVRVSQEVFPL